MSPTGGSHRAECVRSKPTLINELKQAVKRIRDEVPIKIKSHIL